MSEIIREPKQQRSIDTKNKIIQSSFDLFAEKGYFNTNTTEIAKHAGVSTGIVYGYFHDKRDIMIDVLQIYINNVFEPILNTLDSLTAPVDFEQFVPKIVDLAVNVHRIYQTIHEALHSLSSTDKLVNERFITLENDMTESIVNKLKVLGYNNDNLNERVHLAMETIQSYAHEFIYDTHAYIDYKIMRKMVIDMVISLFK